MCRWIAYRGLTTALENYVTEPENSLTAQSRAALESTTSANGDGFGLGWYGVHPEPGLYHETRTPAVCMRRVLLRLATGD